MSKLSIIIPYRNEEFIERTVDGLNKAIRGDTEILIEEDTTPIGQRAMQNKLARKATGDFLMKLDGHVIMKDGFDVDMMRDCPSDGLLTASILNLHAYDWVCEQCGARNYQGVMPHAKCCKWKKDVVWKPKPQPKVTFSYFDSKFAWVTSDDISDKPIDETMSIQGQGWICPTKLYWDLELCDESFGSWGQQGVEMSCKLWLSGHRVLCTKDVWCAHLFRGIDDFPYKRDMSQVYNARVKSHDLFWENKWTGQVRPFKWIIEHFNFPGDWTEDKLHNLRK